MLPDPLIIPNGSPSQMRNALGMVKPAHPKRQRNWFLSFAGNAAVYLFIVGAITLGVPKLLAWHLDTPFPMATITSGSMWPALKTGDLVFIKGVRSKEDIALGDVVVFKNRQNNTFTIHRVVEKKEHTFITQGDANFTKDEPVAYEDAVGKAYTLFGDYVRIPKLGFITVYASSKFSLQP